MLELFRKAWLLVQGAGPGAILKSLLATWDRDRLEAPLPKGPPAWQGIPPLEGAELGPWGGRFFGEGVGLRVRFLGPRAVECTWTPGALPLPYARVRDILEEVQVEGERTGEGWRLWASGLEVRVGASGEVQVLLEGRSLFRALPPERAGEAWRQGVVLDPGEALYGLGERAAPLDLRGRRYRLWNRDPGGSYGPGADPLYLNIPLWLSLKPEGS